MDEKQAIDVLKAHQTRISFLRDNRRIARTEVPDKVKLLTIIPPEQYQQKPEPQDQPVIKDIIEAFNTLGSTDAALNYAKDFGDMTRPSLEISISASRGDIVAMRQKLMDAKVNFSGSGLPRLPKP